MAGIQAALAQVDFNLANAYGFDPAGNYGKYRATFAEAYDICDKLELVQPLSNDLKTVLVYGLYQKADFRIEDGEAPDPSLLERAERICDELCVAQAWNPAHRAMRVLVRDDLADGLEALGRSAEARACRDAAAAAVRGDGAALFEAAVVAADNGAADRDLSRPGSTPGGWRRGGGCSSAAPSNWSGRRSPRASATPRGCADARAGDPRGRPRIPVDRRLARRPRVPRRPFRGSAVIDECPGAGRR